MKPCYLFDIDGTIADCSHRLHFIQTTPKDWRAFFAACEHDTPIQHVIDLINQLGIDNDIIFVSGRSDECRAQTLRWLRAHVGEWFADVDIYMRREGDHRDDDVVKMELLAKIRADGYLPIMAFDDRSRGGKAWRAAGIPCAQVADGDF